MKKIGEEIRFEQSVNFIDRELATIEKKPTMQKLEQI